MINRATARRAARRRTTLELVQDIGRMLRAERQPPTFDEHPPQPVAPAFARLNEPGLDIADFIRAAAAFSCEARDCWHVTQREVMMVEAARRERLCAEG